jgi:hypothetical protein
MILYATVFLLFSFLHGTYDKSVLLSRSRKKSYHFSAAGTAERDAALVPATTVPPMTTGLNV